MHRDADCFYADEFRLPPGATRPEAFFKPDFSPALLLSANYIGRPLVARPALLAAIGITARSFDARRIPRPRIALHRGGGADLSRHRIVEPHRWRHRGEPGRTASPHCATPWRRRGIDAEVLPGRLPETFRVRQTAAVTGKVSIIVPTCAAQGLCRNLLFDIARDRPRTGISRSFASITFRTPKRAARQFVREHADKIVEMPAPFNWSRFNNAAVAASDGEYLVVSQ